MINKTALIVGGNGLIGKNLTQYFEKLQDWKVLVSSRRELHYQTNAQFIKIDLLDQESINAVCDQLTEVTHVFFTAYSPQEALKDQDEINTGMLKNLVQFIDQIAANLRQVVFIQGGKAYGAHLGVYKTPAKETDPRTMSPNFYYSQEDFLRTYSYGKDWSWTAIRPDIIIGKTIGNAMNMANLIGVYGSICKELKIPMRFPGTSKAFEVLVNTTGVDVLSEAMEWVADSDNALGEIFNITNGDIFRWKHMWPKLANFFHVDIDEPQPFSLVEYMADKGELWKKMVQKYNLRNYTIEQLVDWSFGDFIFNVEADAFFDVSKARRFGFHKMQTDSVDYLIQTLQDLREERIIP